MTTARFYISTDIPDSGSFKITGDSHHHLQVLRLKKREVVELLNGNGKQYHAEILEIQKRETVVKILASQIVQNESPIHITLVQGISRGERMDFAIQKSVELGVARIVPIFTEFSQVSLSTERGENKLSHWKKIIISACEQSGRCVVPIIEKPILFSEWIQQKNLGMKWIADPNATQKITTRLSESETVTEKNIQIMIGPEGGFSPAEITQAKNAGFSAISLGPRILRTETAPIVAISLIQKCWGDL